MAFCRINTLKTTDFFVVLNIKTEKVEVNI